MKKLKLLFVAFAMVVGLVVVAEDETSAPTMPDEVTLTSGRVLRNVQVIRWERDRVVLKYTGGVDPIAFSLFKVPSLAELSAIRDSAKKAEAKTRSPKDRTLAGQVFVTTRGAGAYKFAGATVIAFPHSALDSIRSSVANEISTEKARVSSWANLDVDSLRYKAWLKAVQNFTPVAQANTDAEGQYRIVVTAKQPVFLFCATSRIAGSSSEYNVWAVQVDKSDRIDLHSSNQE